MVSTERRAGSVEYSVPRERPVIMVRDEKNLEKIQEAFVDRFSHFHLRLPVENVRGRRKGSIPYGSGRIYFVFGEEDGREYLEFYAYHRMGEDHARIYEDGDYVDLPELCSMFGYDPTIPGDKERKEAEMQKRYRETLDDLVEKGLFDDEPVPNSLAINSYLVLHGEDAEHCDATGETQPGKK